MKISREVITAKMRELTITDWRFEQEPPCLMYGLEAWNELFFIKYFVPWAKTSATAQTLYDWALSKMLTNEITREIDKEILKALTAV